MRYNKKLFNNLIILLLLQFSLLFANGINLNSTHSINADVITNPRNVQNNIILTDIPLEFFRSYETLTISWLPAELNCNLYYSLTPGGLILDNYTNTNTSGTGTIAQTPQDLGLGVGVYYCVVANSDDLVSMEFKLIVESESGVVMTSPIGAIDNPIPTFIWETNPGVPYYQLILSDNPFVIDEDDDGNMIVTGAQAIWQAITPENSIVYGSVDPSGASDVEAPPLVPGIQYNWMVLNNYGNDMPYSSDVVTAPVEFTYEVEDPLDAPILTSPISSTAEDTTFFYGDEYITFEWSEVENAMIYRIFVSEIRFEDGSEVHYTVFDQTTTNNFIDFFAGPVLVSANYTWKVIASDANSNSAISNVSEFSYRVADGSIDFHVKNINNVALPYASIKIDPIDGSSDNAPMLVDENGRVSKTLPVGTYIITTDKEYYETRKDTTDITINSTRNMSIILSYSPSSIYGQIVDQDGQLVQNGFVTAINADDEVREAASSSGSYNLSLTPGYWTFSARKETYSQGNEIELMINSGANLELDNLELIKNEKNVTGVVLNTGGVPLSAINVFAECQGNTIQKVSNSSGSFEFAGLEFGNWSFYAQKTGYYSPPPQEIEITNASPVLITLSNIVLNPQANIISGNANNSSVVLANVTITATPSTGSPISTTTNNYGNYSLDLPGGNYIFSAFKQNYSSQNTHQLNLSVGETLDGIDFVLIPNESFITGTVTSGGFGLPDALVSSGENSDYSNSTGQFSLSVTPGTYEVSVSKTSYSSTEIKTVSIGAGQTVEQIDFSMAPNASVISGKVSSSGAGISGGTVKGYKILSSGNTVTITAIPTDQSGNYELNLLPGNYLIWAEKNNFLCMDSLDIQVQAGQQIPNQNIAMIRNEATISGIIRKSDGALLRAANIYIEDVSNSSNNISTVSGANGQFSVIVIPGQDYDISATKDGYSSVSETSGILDVGVNYDVNFTLSALPSLLRGLVVNDNGEILSGVNITIENQDDSENSTSTETGLNGKYSVGINHGNYNVTAQLLGHNESVRSVEIVPGQTDTLDFILEENFSTLYGVVTDQQDHSLSGALVTATRSTGGGGTILTDNNGEYSITDLLPGSYSISITKDNYEPSNVTNEVIPVGVSIQYNASIQLYTSSLIVNVQNNGQDFSEATITVENQNTGENVSGLTDNSGNVTFTGLLANVDYLVSANAVNYFSDAQLTSLSPGQETSLDFELTLTNARISGNISYTNSSNEDVGLSDVSIYALSEDGFSGNSISNADGSFSINNLNPGREYSITLVKTGYSDVARDAVDLQQENQSVGTLSMIPNNRKINGIVKDQGGTALNNVPVSASSEISSGVAMTNSSGEFTISGLAPFTTYDVVTNKEEQGWINVEKEVTIEDNENNSGGTFEITINDARIFGNITDSNTGDPITNATVILTNSSTGNSFTKNSQHPDGSFNFKYLTGGAYTLKIIKELYLAKTLNISISARQVKEQNVEIDYSAPVTISGTLKDTDERPISGENVFLINDQQTLFVETDESGGFSFTDNVIPYTTTSVSTNLDGEEYDNDIEELTIENSNQTTNLIIDIHTASLNGSIKDVDNNLLLNTEITLAKENSEGVYEILENIVSESGNFVFDYLYEGNYKITAVRSGYYENNNIVEIGLTDFSNESVTINLTSLPNALSGAISALYNEESISIKNSIVDIKQANTILFTDTTGSAGTFQFVDLVYGEEYEITCRKTGFADYNETFQYSDDKKEINIELQMIPNAILGSVFHESQEMANVPVNAKSLEGYINTVYTDDFGDYMIDGIVGLFELWAINADTSLVSINQVVEVSTGRSIYQNLNLVSASTIKGAVTYNGNGKAGVNITVENINTGAIVNDITDVNGNYQVSGLNSGTYRIEPFLEGFNVNENIQIKDLGVGETIILPDYTLKFINNSITGVVTNSKTEKGISNVEVLLQDNLKTILDTIYTNPDGNFLFSGLNDGDYVISVYHIGYNEISDQSVTLSNGQSDPPTVDFVMVPKELTIFGKIQDNRSQALEGVEVVAVSTDTSVSTLSDEKGLYSLLTGKQGMFLISAFKTNYDTVKSNGELSFQINSVEKNFLLTPDPSSISGKVQIIDKSGSEPDTVSVNYATVKLKSNSIGYEQQQVISDGTKNFVFNDLEQSEYDLTISATYFVDGNPITFDYQNNISLNIAEDYENENVYFLYDPALANISGSILIHDNEDQKMDESTIYLMANNSVIDSASVDENGIYQLNNIDPGNYTLSIDAKYDNEDFFHQSDEFELMSAENFIYDYTFEYFLSSFSLNLTEDGTKPISEAKIKIISTDHNLTLFTDEMGTVSTDSIFHSNKNIMIKITKNSGSIGTFIEAKSMNIMFDDIRHVNIDAQLPLQFDMTQIQPRAAKDSIPIKLYKATEYNDAIHLYYNSVDGNPQTIEMIESGDGSYVMAYIPAQKKSGSTDFYFKSNSQDLNMAYSNENTKFTWQITSEGILTDKYSTISPTESIFAFRDSSVFEIDLKDDIGNSLNNDIIERGFVDWSLSDTSLGVLTSSNNKLQIIYSSPKEIGADLSGEIRANIMLDGVLIELKTSLQIRDMHLSKINISGPEEFSNRETAFFGIQAVSDSGFIMTLPITWEEVDSSIGVFSVEKGGLRFVPDSTFIGKINLSISATDKNYDTTIVSEKEFSIYQNITSDMGEIVLNSGYECSLILPENMLITGSAKIYVKPLFKIAAMKLTGIENGLESKVFDVKSNKAESVFQTMPGINFSVDTDGGNIAYWNSDDLKWVVVEAQNNLAKATIESNLSLTAIPSWAEYGVVAPSLPLGIYNLQLKPNPFTPYDMVGNNMGLQISFKISSDKSRYPNVSAKIYNMRGTLVRTLAKNKAMLKGDYGVGETGSLYWDGKTDNGMMARNGRYILHLVVKDAGKEEQMLKSIVLIK